MQRNAYYMLKMCLHVYTSVITATGHYTFTPFPKHVLQPFITYYTKIIVC